MARDEVTSFFLLGSAALSTRPRKGARKGQSGAPLFEADEFFLARFGVLKLAEFPPPAIKNHSTK
jgi:hypothetical protein